MNHVSQRMRWVTAMLFASSVGCGPPLIPTTGTAELQPWLEAGHYNQWQCETQPHASTSWHGRGRRCTNETLAQSTQAQLLALGSAAVNELLDSDNLVIGHAVMVRVYARPGAANWYFYQHVRPGTVIPSVSVSPTGVVADGRGITGQALTVCANCHAQASRDFVYMP